MSAVLAGAGDIREVRMFGGRRFHDERQPGRCVLPSRTTTPCRKGSWGRSACPVRRRADVMRGWRKIALAVTNRDAGERGREIPRNQRRNNNSPGTGAMRKNRMLQPDAHFEFRISITL